MKPQELLFQLSDANEQIVRSYECTRIKRWFVPPTLGYLTVTNKRIVFHSSGTSLTGKSSMLNEMPLDDVVGLNVYEGVSVSWLRFLIFAVLAYVGTQLIVTSPFSFIVSYWMAIVLVLPFAIIWLFKNNILNDQLREQGFQSVDKILKGGVQVNRDLHTYLPYARMLLYVGLAIVGWQVTLTSGMRSAPVLAKWLFLLIVYGFIFLNLFGRRPTFSLMVGSKTMKGPGIFIPGDSFRLLSNRNGSAMEALDASPAADASLVTRELGALLLDLQQLGDFGIQKWKQ